MDEPIALESHEQPAVVSFSQTEGLIVEPEKTEFDEFLAYWREIDMDPDRLLKVAKEEEKVDTGGNWSTLMGNFRILQYIIDGTIPEKETKKVSIDLHGTGIDAEDLDDSDIPFGAAVLDKQAQLQSAFSILMGAKAELESALLPIARKFRGLAELARRFEMVMRTDCLSNRVLPVISPGCRSGVYLVLDRDADGRLVWGISPKIYLNIDGQSVQCNELGSDYAGFLCQASMTALFQRMITEIIRGSHDYSVTAVSKRFTVGQTQFSQTDKAVGNCLSPVFLPALVHMVYEADAEPYAKFVRCTKALSLIKQVRKIVLENFTPWEFLKIRSCQKRTKLMIHIDSVYQRHMLGEGLTVIVDETKVYVSNGQLPMLCVSVDKDHCEDRIQHWCREQIWNMFTVATYRVASRFGFPLTKDGNTLTVKCDDRDVLFTRSNEIIMVKVTQGKDYFSFRWESISVIGHYRRLIYLFFAPLFGRPVKT